MSEFNLTDICRACMTYEVGMTSIFMETLGPPIDVMLMAIASLNPQPDDCLPSQICKYCLEQVEKSYSFRQQVIHTDTEFRMALSKGPDLHSIQDINTFMQSLSELEVSDNESIHDDMSISGSERDSEEQDEVGMHEESDKSAEINQGSSELSDSEEQDKVVINEGSDKSAEINQGSSELSDSEGEVVMNKESNKSAEINQESSELSDLEEQDEVVMNEESDESAEIAEENTELPSVDFQRPQSSLDEDVESLHLQLSPESIRMDEDKSQNEESSLSELNVSEEEDISDDCSPNRFEIYIRDNTTVRQLKVVQVDTSDEENSDEENSDDDFLTDLNEKYDPEQDIDQLISDNQLKQLQNYETNANNDYNYLSSTKTDEYTYYDSLSDDSLDYINQNTPDQKAIIIETGTDAITEDLNQLDNKDSSVVGDLSNGNRLHVSLDHDYLPQTKMEFVKMMTKVNTSKSDIKCHSLIVECPKCTEVFNNISAMEKHLELHSALCDKCGQQYESISESQTHTCNVLLDSGKCPICMSKVDDQQKLCKHFKNCANGLKEFHCKMCDQDFVSNMAYFIHTRRHFGITVYVCKYCKEVFMIKKDWLDHVSLHGEFAHLCVPSGTFKRKRTLKLHMKKTKHKSDTCTDIDNSTLQKPNLKLHVAPYHPSFSCKLCSLIFNDVNSFIEHKRTSHCILPKYTKFTTNSSM